MTSQTEPPAERGPTHATHVLAITVNCLTVQLEGTNATERFGADWTRWTGFI